MKLKIQLRREANERAARRATLSTSQKLTGAYAIASAGYGDCKRETTRLERQLKEEDTQARLAGKVIIPSSKCEWRKR